MTGFSETFKQLLKRVYRNVPFKKQFFLLLKAVWSPPLQIYQHLYFNGAFKVRVAKKREFAIMHFGQQIENELFWNGLEGGWEKHSVKIWKQLCEHASAILDVGANTGLFSMIAKTVSPSAEVHAFEPISRVFKRLLRNAAINGFDLHAEEVALSNYDGEATVYDTLEDHILSVTVNKNIHSPGVRAHPVTILVKTMSSYAQEKNLKRIDLIKIDVETHEAEVLEGMGELLSKFKPAFLIEVLNDEVGARIQHLIDGLGYLYFNIDETTGAKQVFEIRQSSHFNYLLCSEQIARKLHLL